MFSERDILGQVSQIHAQMSETGKNAMSDRVELQADFFLGISARMAPQKSGSLEQGDIFEAINAAAQIGGDTLHRNAELRVQPHRFTHGTSAQRQHGVLRGFESGTVSNCDMFSTNRL